MTKPQSIRSRNPNPVANSVDEAIEFLKRPIARHFAKVVLKNARKYIKRLKKINNTDPKINNIDLSSVRFYEIRYAMIDYWYSLLEAPFKVIYFFGSFGSFFASPFWVGSILLRPVDLLVIPALALNTLGLYILVLFLAFFNRLIPRTLKATMPVLMVIILAATTSLIISSVSNSIVFLIASVTSFLTANMLALLFAFVGITLANIASMRLIKYHHPEAFIIHTLVRLIARLENKSFLWVDVYFRRRLLLDLEEIASCVEKDLSRIFKSGDKITDFWMRTTFRRIAAAFREKKLWIITPKSDTRYYLTKSLANSLISLVRGSWNELEQEEPKKVSFQQGWLDHLKNILRVVIVGGSPIIVIWIIQASPLAMGAPLKDYVIGGSILWVLFTAITTIDPMFSVKIDALKDVTSLLPIIGKKS